MWRTRAVVSLLVQDVAGLDVPEIDSDRGASAEPAAEIEPLSRACRRASLVVALDWLALLVLFLLRDATRPFLPVGASVDTVFTLGALAVASHAGFRWAQLLKYRVIARSCAALRERDPS